MPWDKTSFLQWTLYWQQESVLVLNIKYAKLGIFKNAWEFWSLVFVESEWDLGLYLPSAVQKIVLQPCKCGAETLLLWSHKASSSRGAGSRLDSAVQVSWWRNIENAGLESRASSAESRHAGQCSAWQTVHIKSGWFMELFLLKASSCTLESGAARLVKIQYPDGLNWLPATVITVVKL